MVENTAEIYFSMLDKNAKNAIIGKKLEWLSEIKDHDETICEEATQFNEFLAKK